MQDGGRYRISTENGIDSLLAAHPPAQHIRAIGVDEVSVKAGTAIGSW